MPDWREHAEAGEWLQIDWTKLEDDEQRELYQRLCLVVPKIERSNLMERIHEYALPAEVSGANLKHAALMLNDMSGLFDDEPDWLTVAESYAREVLGESSRTNDGTIRKPDDAEYLSREWHALSVLDLAEACRTTFGWASATVDDPGPVTEEWLHSWMQQAAGIAFTIGRHMQAAWGKEFEPHAIRGIKTLAAAGAGGIARKGAMKPHTEAILSKMEQLIGSGHSVASAADATFRNGLGSSANANRALWNRKKLSHTPPM